MLNRNLCIYINDDYLTNYAKINDIKNYGLDLSYHDVLTSEVLKYIVPFMQHHPEIKLLNLRNGRIIDYGVQVLAKFANLTSLDLSYNRIGPDGAQALVTLPLISLNLSHNKPPIGDEGAKAVATIPTLTSLNVSNNQIGKGIKALANHPNLKFLYVAWNATDKEVAEEFANNKLLTTLDVSHNLIENDEARKLIKNKTLTTLNLSNNYIGMEGAKAIAKELENNTNLTSLNVSANAIWCEGFRALTNSPYLQFLNASNTGITGDKINALPTNNLTSLDLSDNRIGSTDTNVLANLPHVKFLDLSRNPIGDSGAIALAKNTTLTALNVCGATTAATIAFPTVTEIGLMGATALMNNITLINLDMSGNNISLDSQGRTWILTTCQSGWGNVRIVPQEITGDGVKIMNDRARIGTIATVVGQARNRNGFFQVPSEVAAKIIVQAVQLERPEGRIQLPTEIAEKLAAKNFNKSILRVG